MPEFIQERKSKDGKITTYRVKIPYYDKNQQRRFYSASFNTKQYGTKKIALDMAKECRDKMRKQLNVDGIITTFEIYTPEQILELSYEVFPLSLETKRKHFIMFNRYIKDFAGDDFSKITQKEIQQSLNAMTNKSADNINRIYSLWKRMYRAAIFNEIVAFDYTTKVKIPKSNMPYSKRNDITSKQQLDEVCALINLKVNNHNATLLIGALYFMYYTGMRPSEVYALERKHINRDKKTITVCQALGSTETNQHVIINTKTYESTRIIPYPEQLELYIETLWNQEFLFKRKNGKLLNSDYVGGVLRKLTGGTFHCYMLRHQFSTDLLKNNVDLRTIQDLMGHASSSMTLEYARSNAESMQKAIKMR